MRTCIRDLLVFAVLLGCAQARSPVESAAGTTTSPVIIADGQVGPPAADMSLWEASPAVKEAIASARSYWSALEPGYQEEVHVMAAATGAFTRPDVHQHAVFFSMSKVPRGFPKRGLALIEGERLLRNFAFVSLDDDVWALPDIDLDGRDELVFGGSFGMGGQVSSGVTLVVLEEGGLRDLWTATVYESACGAGYEGSMSARIQVVPGSAIMIQRYIQPSCESETWQAAGEPERLELVPPEGSRYVEIPRE
jgi:hypothetical protein